MRKENNKSMKPRTQMEGYFKCVHMRTKRRGLKNRSRDTYVLNEWPQTTIMEYFLCISPPKYTRTSWPPRKVPLFSSIIIAIILSYAIIWIYTILHIYLHVPKTDGLAELHWVIRLSVLDKINSILSNTSMEYDLRFQE